MYKQIIFYFFIFCFSLSNLAYSGQSSQLDTNVKGRGYQAEGALDLYFERPEVSFRNGIQTLDIFFERILTGDQYVLDRLESADFLDERDESEEKKSDEKEKDEKKSERNYKVFSKDFVKTKFRTHKKKVFVNNLVDSLVKDLRRVLGDVRYVKNNSSEISQAINLKNKKTLRRVLSDFYKNTPYHERVKILEDWRSVRSQFKDVGQWNSPKILKLRASFLNKVLSSLMQKKVVYDLSLADKLKGRVKSLTPAKGRGELDRSELEKFKKLESDVEKFQRSVENFISTVQSDYNLKATKSELEAINLMHEIFKSDKISEKEIRMFRRVLNKMGLPKETHNNEHLRLYLSTFAQQYQGRSVEGVAPKFSDADVLNLLRSSKVYFDDIHFENLKEMNKFMNIVKGYPSQYILFQMAIGASIFRQNITDPLLYGADKNPGQFGQFASQSLTPSSIASFFLFIVVSQKTNYLLYKGGRYFDSKFLRVIGPSVGLAAGFFISSLAQELSSDPDFKACVASYVGLADSDKYETSYISPCESSYRKWIKGKWKNYAVDISTLIGASVISHKIIHSLMMAVRATPWGSAILSRTALKIGARASGWAGFFVTLYAFMEVHHVLEKYIGQPLKKHLNINSVKSDLVRMDGLKKKFMTLKEKNVSLTDNNNLVGNKNVSNVFNEDSSDSLISRIKTMGFKFREWAVIKTQLYLNSFQLWNQKLNKSILVYQESRFLLGTLFNNSGEPYSLSIEVKNPYPQGDYRMGSAISFDAMKFNENKEYYGDILCSYLEDSSKVNLKVLSELCENPSEFNLSDEGAIGQVVDGVLIAISDYIDFSSLEDTIDVYPYLGVNLEEVFSSEFLINDLSLSERSKFVKSLLQSLEGFRDGKDLDKNNKSLFRYVQKFCSYYSSGLKEYGQCIQNHKEDDYRTIKGVLETRFVLASLYTLKRYIYNSFPDVSSKDALIGSKKSFSDLNRFWDLVNLFDVYKKGESLFLTEEASNVFLAKNQKKLTNDKEVDLIHDYPYIFFQNILCDFKNSSSKGDGFFAPQVFDRFSSFCKKEELAYLNSFQPAKVKDAKEFHRILFDKRVTIDSVSYETLWLALEDHIRKNFTSKKELLEFFEEKSSSELDRLAKAHISSLEELTKSYFIPEMINFDASVAKLKTCEEIVSHYSIEKLKNVFFAQNLSGLEISLFQFIYWTDQLNFSENVDTSNQSFLNSKCKAIELLKSYHDAYAQDGDGSHLIVPSVEERDKISKNIMDNKINLFDKLDKMRSKNSKPVLIDSKDILYTLLRDTSIVFVKHPTVFKSILSRIEQNQKAPQGGSFNDVDYALSYELYKSLQDFFLQLQVLQMKQTTQEALGFASSK